MYEKIRSKNLWSCALLPVVFMLAPVRAGASHCDRPALLIILDRSMSMLENTVPTGETRWEAAGAAVESVAMEYGEGIDFGLMVFPFPDHCGPGSIVVEPGPESPAEISDCLSRPLPEGGSWSPIAQSLDSAAVYLGELDAYAKKVAVLITDGEQWCFPYEPGARFDPVGAAERLVAAAADLHVVGFGGEGVDALVLNTIAFQSGTHREGCNPEQADPMAEDNCYQAASDMAALCAALETIAAHASEEVCDGVDNDCDGDIDEDLSRECATLCGKGVEICMDGEWVLCNAPQPEPEVCNKADDDCDTVVDEECACMIGDTRICGTNAGECRTGIQECEGYEWTGCRGAVWPKFETCDGLDNDCNGVADNGVICPNGGLCVNGECFDPQPDAYEPVVEFQPPYEAEPMPGCGCAMTW
ncbi:MAG: MopE-related protein [Pseudomonadota bacterium]